MPEDGSDEVMKRDYEKEAEAVCKLWGGDSWFVNSNEYHDEAGFGIRFDHANFVVHGRCYCYNVHDKDWLDLVKKATVTRDYEKEAEAVAKSLNAVDWEIDRQYVHFFVVEPCGGEVRSFDMDSAGWEKSVRKATEVKMTDEELDAMLEELYQNEVFLEDMNERLTELTGSRDRTIEVINEVERRIKETRDRLKGN